MTDILTFFFVFIFYVLVFIVIDYVILYFVYRGWQRPIFFPYLGQVQRDTIREMRRILTESTSPLTIVDLRADNGYVLNRLARTFPQHHFIGYSKKAALLNKKTLPNLTFRNTDHPFHPERADVVMLYQNHQKPADMRFLKYMKPGARFVCGIFPQKHLSEESKCRSCVWGKPVFIYTYRI